MPCSRAKASIARYFARFSSVVFWMSWSRQKTGSLGSTTRFAPIDLNFFMTGEVLSWVMTWRGRIETKSPARTGRPFGPAVMWAWVIFSTTVCPIAAPSLSAVRAEQVHQLGDRGELLRLPDGVLHLRARLLR